MASSNGNAQGWHFLAELPSDDLLALDEAFTKPAAEAAANAELVKLLSFAGFSIDEAANLKERGESLPLG